MAAGLKPVGDEWSVFVRHSNSIQQTITVGYVKFACFYSIMS